MSSSQSQRDPYEVLGIDRNATPKEIRSAYKKLALKHHPDKSKENKEEATQRFAEISHAYETLTNPDATTTTQQQSQYQQQGFSAGGGFGTSPFGASPFGVSSLFDEFFGGSRAGGFGGGGGLFFNPSFHFTDPFELFNQVFGDEFGNSMNVGSHRHRSHDPMASMMSSMMGGGMGGGMGGSFQTFTSSTGGGFGGFSGGSMMSTSSSSQSVYDPATGGTKLIKTTTQTINGQTTKRVETTLLYPDGRQETTVEELGDSSNRPKALLPPSEPPQQLPSSQRRQTKELPSHSSSEQHGHHHDELHGQRRHHNHPKQQQQPQEEEAPVIDLTAPSIAEECQEDEDDQEEDNTSSEEEEKEKEEEYDQHNENKVKKRKRQNNNENEEGGVENPTEQQHIHDCEEDEEDDDNEDDDNDQRIASASKKQKVTTTETNIADEDDNSNSNTIVKQYIKTREELESLTMKQLRQICKCYHIAMVGNHFKKSQLVDRLTNLIQEQVDGRIVLEVNTRPCTPPPKKEIPVPEIPVDISLEELTENFTNDQLRLLCRHYGERQIGGKPILAKRLYNFLQQSQGNVPSFLLDTTKGDENEEEVESKLGSSTTNSNKATPASQSQPSQAQKGGPTTNLSMNHHQNPYGIPIPPPPPPIIPITGVLGPPTSMNSVAPPPHPMYGGVPIPPPPPYPAFVTAVPPPYPYPYYTVPPPPPPPPPTTTTAASPSQHVTDGRVPSPPTPAATDDN